MMNNRIIIRLGQSLAPVSHVYATPDQNLKLVFTSSIVDTVLYEFDYLYSLYKT